MSADTPQTPEQDAVLRAAIDRSLRHPVMFFFTSGAAWLAVSLLLGLIASLKVTSPGVLSGSGWLTYGRIFAAHTTTLIYGWGFQAAFGAVIWLMARLSRQECRAAGIILTAGHVWNATIALGVTGILSGYGTAMPWMEMPVFAWVPLILCYFTIVIWSMVQFKVRPTGHVFISQWYLLAALIWLPWVFITTHVLIYGFSGSPLMAAAVNAWYHSGLILLFFIPIAIGSAYYLVPKVSGRPVHSYSLSMLGFWSLAVIAPWAGMQKLAGAPIPNFLPYVGAAATILFAIPAIAVGFNLLKTAQGAPDTVVNSPTLRFTVAGIVSLLVLGFSSVLLNIPDGLRLSQFSFSNYGFDLMAIYGCFSFVAFGLIYFVVPRLTCREWLSTRLIKMHFMLSVYGVAMLVLFTLFGGLMQGQGQEEFSLPWESASIRSFPYSVGTTVVWCFLLFSNFFFFIHLALMWLRLGRRSTHPTLLGVVHHDDLHDRSHGPEGDVDNAGPGSAPAHSH
jgi:cytochrome c oxidase cbb3-type subunit 1